MKLWLRYVVFAAVTSALLSIYLLFQKMTNQNVDELTASTTTDKYENLRPSYFASELIRFLHDDRETAKRKIRYDQCSMSTCFNFTKCLWKQPRIYVYPAPTDVIISPVYEKILHVIRDSVYYTEDPAEACLFVLSLDTTDRDRISDNYIKDLSARIDSLPADVWNEGRNHLIFNLYYGSYPEYSQRDIGFTTKYAIMAWASADSSYFREGFDISFPLFHKEHPLRVAPNKITLRNPYKDTFLSTFKGKRYVYGIGSNTRDSLYHLHNQNSTIVLTTCRHNTDWKKFEDSRCERDNREYDNYDYVRLLENASFCLTPRGRRLGSFRFLEALKAGCIPVILSDGWELPFSELVDWAQASVLFHERAVYFTTDLLSGFSADRIARMKLETQRIYRRYFASVEKIVLSTIQIVFDRLQVPRRATHTPAEAIFASKSPKCTVIVQAAKRFSNRLTKIVGLLSDVEQVEKFIVLWPKARGSPPEDSAFATRQKVEFVWVSDSDQGNLFNLAPSQILGDFLVLIDERIRFRREEFLGLLHKSAEFPTRLVTYHALQHQLHANQTQQTSAAKTPLLPNYTLKLPNTHDGTFSIGLLSFAAMHRANFEAYTTGPWISKSLKTVAASISQCHTLLFNVFMVEWSVGWAPILLKNTGNASSMVDAFLQQSSNLKHYTTCLNKLARVGYYEDHELSLIVSNIRHIS